MIAIQVLEVQEEVLETHMILNMHYMAAIAFQLASLLAWYLTKKKLIQWHWKVQKQQFEQV